MKFTGERFIDDLDGNWQMFHQHMGRYLFAQRFVSDKKVLDAACGSGFGTRLLAHKAAYVLGIDLSPEAIIYSKDRYRAQNLDYSVMDCLQLGLPSSNLDVVVSFETIEHLHDPDKFTHEVHRILQPGGSFLLSTPNRPLYSIYNMGKPNEFHLSEMTLQEFQLFLGKYFDQVTIYGQGFFTPKEAVILSKELGQSVPVGDDHLLRKITRVLIRTLLSEKRRARFLLELDIWANKWNIGGTSPECAIYIIALCKKN